MDILKKTRRRFFIGLGIPLALLGLYCGLMTLILTRAGETMPVGQIVEKLDRTHGLYGSALYQRTYYFKERIYRFYRPDVAALGSSRVLQFRSDYFTTSFVNLGSVGLLDDVVKIGMTLFSEHPPKVLILSMDYWWFNNTRDILSATHHPEDVSLKLVDILEPVNWLASGKLRFSDIDDILFGTLDDVGISAISRGDGFDRFGSFYYTAIYNGRKKTQDAKFSSTLHRMRHGEGVHVHSDGMSEKAWRKMVRFLDFLKNKDIKTILIIPPVAPTINDALLDSKDHTYVDMVRSRMTDLAQKRDIPFFDFHDSRKIDSGDCEYYDGVHGGENTYNRMLFHMALDDEALRTIVDMPKLAWAMRNLKDRASANADEIDFLTFGCDKSFKADQQ